MSEINNLDAPSRPGRLAAGFRRETPHAVTWRERAEDFAGLMDGAAHPHQLIDALRQARAGLKLTDAEMALIADLYAATQPKDWDSGRRPIAWPSNHTLASRQGKSISAIQRMVARLIDRGLIVMRESPTGKRYGFRDAEGHISKAYGFDLSLLAVRYAEFRAIAEARQQHEAALRVWRSRAIVAKKRLLTTIEAAEEAGLWTTFWEEAEHRTQDIAGRLSHLRDLARLQTYATELEGLLASVIAVFAKAVPNPTPTQTDAKEFNDEGIDLRRAHRVDATLNNSTDFPLNKNCNKTHQSCKSRPLSGGYREFAGTAHGDRHLNPGDALRHVEPDTLLAKVPELISARDEGMSGWTGLAAACAKLRHRYEISHLLWEDAVDRVGKPMALAIFAVMIARGRGHYQSPGGCFRRLIERSEAGTLNLLPSYYGLLSGTSAQTATEQAQTDGSMSLAARLNTLKSRLN